MTRRLLVFGINYAPEPTGVGVVTTRIAESMAADGWEVEVVTGVPHYPSWRRSAVPKPLGEERVRVHRRPHYVPARQTAVLRGAYEATWLCAALPDALLRRRPDAVLGIVPSLSGAALAAIAARRHRVPLTLLFFDLMGRAAEQSGLPGGAGFSGVVTRVERSLGRRASRVAVIAEGFHDYLVEGGVDPSRISVVDVAALGAVRGVAHGGRSRDQTRARLGWRPDDFVVLYSGSIGYKQALEHVVEAARLAGSDGGLRFVLQGDGNQRSELERRAKGLRLRNLEFRPLASSDELVGMLTAADALLLHQRASVRNMSFPSKLAMYLRSGSPVVAAVASDDGVARELAAAGAAVIVPPERPAELLASLDELRRDPTLARALVDAASAYGRQAGDQNAATIAELVSAAIVSHSDAGSSRVAPPARGVGS